MQVGPHRIDRTHFDWAEVERNPFLCPDARAAELWADYLDDIRKDGSSVGAVIEIVAEGVPAGWGAPIYGKLDADLAGGDDVDQRGQGRGDRRGLRRRRLTGEDNADEMRAGTMDRSFCPTTPAACSAAFPPASPSSCALP